jgi:hypothetical protein
VKIFKIEEILQKIEDCIVNKKPFSHIRFGDGGLKFINSVLNNDHEQLKDIVEKEGIPNNLVVEIFELWGYYARKADFIDCPEVYYNGQFWERLKGSMKQINLKTKELFLNWEDLYSRSEFDNENYCNPESNILAVLKRYRRSNLLNIMHGRNICIITDRPEIKEKLERHGYLVDVVPIVGHYQNQYKNSFNIVCNIIKERSNDYDLWLVAAGELGRVYSGLIKENGGRCFDIGYVIDYWLGTELHSRLTPFITRAGYLDFKLYKYGVKFDQFI